MMRVYFYFQLILNHLISLDVFFLVDLFDRIDLLMVFRIKAQDYAGEATLTQLIPRVEVYFPFFALYIEREIFPAEITFFLQ